MAVTPSRFFKVILASSLEDKKLKIPEMFVRKFGDELSTVATLTVPNGRAWKVGLIKDGQKIWLREGLQDFMEYHSICAGYFLVFKYRKNSDFSVRIFDMSACEVNYACNGKDASNEKKNSIHQDQVATQDSATLNPFLTPLGCKVFRGCTSRPPYQEMSSVSRVNQEKQIEVDQIKRHKMEEMEVMSESKEPELNLTAKYYSRRSLHCKGQQSKSIEYFAPCLVDKDMDKAGRTEFEKSKHYGEDEHKTVVSKYKDNQDLLVQVEHEGRMRFTFYESASARKRMATAEDREKVINAAKSFEPTNPFCRVVLRPSYLYRGCIMYLPSCFAEKHLNGISGFIKLQMPDGKQWPVRCLYKGGRAKFSQGWYEFTLENNLGEGDVCVFEVLRVKDFVLKVTAFRIMERTGYVN